MIVCGIDPSLVGTAIVSGVSPSEYHVEKFSSKPLGDDVRHRMKRLERLVASVDRHLSSVKPDVILIEHYSFGSKNGGEYLGEYGGCLRWHLVDHTPNVFEVAPLTLKKFATGKGAGKKEAVIAHITAKYGVIFETNDEYDAFALYQMGLVLSGESTASNEAQRESVAKVIGDRRVEFPRPQTAI